MCAFSPQITHVIFDFDGTLVNTEQIVSQAINDFAQSVGKQSLLTAEIETRLLGVHFKNRVEQIIKELELDTDFNECVSEIMKLILKHIDQLSLMPGIQEAVDYFDRNNIPMAIASSNKLDLIKQTIGRIDDQLFNIFRHVVGGDDEEVTHDKPNPDVFIVAARRFSPMPDSMDRVLVFEDNEIGVEAAIAAGMKCVLIPDHRLFDTSLQNSKATNVLKSMTDFSPELFCSSKLYGS